MKMRVAYLCLAALLLNAVVVLAQTAPSAENKIPNVSEEKGKESNSAQALALLSQAEDLVRYARENESAVAMLAAVQMLERVHVTEKKDEAKPETKKASDAAQQEKKQSTQAPTLDPQKLLAEAKPWARKDPHLSALLSSQKPKSGGGATLGAVGGPYLRLSVVDGGYKNTWKFDFRAGETGRVAVIGDGDTDLDLYVYDQNGNLIAKDDDSSDNCEVAFRPYYTSTFSVVIVNRGSVLNRHMLATN